jgi:hypothetical protein
MGTVGVTSAPFPSVSVMVVVMVVVAVRSLSSGHTKGRSGVGLPSDPRTVVGWGKSGSVA